ncbi:hypothetical protein BpHYR1_042454 [Brachionus plicatilis]|uniref:Uncharacterized protein n=1 Tax=Brachionus plicatilis TaxID=10195 RepID=A0A3M7T0Q5_BRAPC|nr:hypothetical protein BpHYR1_042454 [Brachionus plicatilis]
MISGRFAGKCGVETRISWAFGNAWPFGCFGLTWCQI